VAVSHLTNVLRFDEFLNKGGRHLFEITADEMPELEKLDGLQQGLKIACKVTTPRMKRGTWTGIVDQLAARSGSCVYKRISPDTYRVVCTIPPRP